MRTIEFKTSVALDLFGMDISPKKLLDWVGREKPAGQHHMRYTPSDLRAARHRAVDIVFNEEHLQNSQNSPLPPLIITRMTKGGVGKTSTAVNLAVSFGMMGFRALLIDADPQASATQLLQGDTDSDPAIHHIGHFLLEKSDAPSVDLAKAIFPIYEGGYLDLLPADITLAEADASLVVAMNSHERALRFFNRNRDYFGQHYDVIIVDTAPGTTPIGLAFTYAAKTTGKIVAVVEPVGDCIRALESLSSNLHELKSLTDANIGMEIIINKYHPSLKHVKDNMGVLYTKYGSFLNDTIVPQFSGFARQMDPTSKNSKPLVESDPSSVGARALIEIAKSMIKSYGIAHPGLRTANQKARS